MKRYCLLLLLSAAAVAQSGIPVAEKNPVVFTRQEDQKIFDLGEDVKEASLKRGAALSKLQQSAEYKAYLDADAVVQAKVAARKAAVDEIAKAHGFKLDEKTGQLEPLEAKK